MVKKYRREFIMAKKKAAPKKTKQIYVYHDSDHGDVEVFDEMEKAKAYARTQWGEEQDWEDCGDSIHDLVSDYVFIYIKEIRTDMPKEE